MKAATELMPVIRKEGLVGVVIHTTMEQLSNLRWALQMADEAGMERLLAEVPEWTESMDRFIDSGWRRS